MSELEASVTQLASAEQLLFGLRVRASIIMEEERQVIDDLSLEAEHLEADAFIVHLEQLNGKWFDLIRLTFAEYVQAHQVGGVLEQPTETAGD